MEKLNMSEVTKDVLYTWECRLCGEYNTDSNITENEVYCEGCGTTFKLQPSEPEN